MGRKGATSRENGRGGALAGLSGFSSLAHCYTANRCWWLPKTSLSSSLALGVGLKDGSPRPQMHQQKNKAWFSSSWLPPKP